MIPLSLKVGMLSVFLSVSLSDRHNFGQKVIIAGIATNTQGANKDQYPHIAASGNSLDIFLEIFVTK